VHGELPESGLKGPPAKRMILERGSRGSNPLLSTVAFITSEDVCVQEPDS